MEREREQKKKSTTSAKITTSLRSKIIYLTNTSIKVKNPD